MNSMKLKIHKTLIQEYLIISVQKLIQMNLQD